MVNLIEKKVIFEKLMKYGKNTGELENVTIDTSFLYGQYYEEMTRNLNVMNRTRENVAFRRLASNRPIIGRGIIFVKKVIRKCLKWYIEPICFQQTEFNNSVTSVSGRLIEVIGNQEERIKKLEEVNQQIAEIVQTYEQLEQEKLLLNKKVLDIEEYVSQIKSLNIDMDSSDAFSFSQAGEDVITAYFLKEVGIPIEKISYLDLGANHAKKLSNTYYFYKRGCRGVLVEANPDLISELKFYRNEDLVLNKCIGDTEGDTVEFYIMNGDGVSTVDKSAAEEMCRINPNLHIEKIVSIGTITVSAILKKYFEEAPTILNIDIEGKEMDVLEEMDFKHYRPFVIIVEMIPYKMGITVDRKNNKIMEFMLSKGYVEYAFTGINSIFIDKMRV